MKQEKVKYPLLS